MWAELGWAGLGLGRAGEKNTNGVAWHSLAVADAACWPRDVEAAGTLVEALNMAFDERRNALAELVALGECGRRSRW